MKLLITTALNLNSEEKINFIKHDVYYCADNDAFDESKIGISKNDIDCIICNFFFLYNDLGTFENIKCIQLTSVGLDRVPVEYIKSHDIRLFTAGSAYAIPMAEWAMTKTLDVIKHSSYFFSNQQECKWEKRRDVFELAGKRALIIGYGNVGRNVAKRLSAFDVEVLALDVYSGVDEYGNTIDLVSKIDNYIDSADIIYLTAPATKDTFHILDEDKLGKIKDNAIIVNVSRGTLIDEEALLFFLNRGKFLGVALDVFENEPLPENSELWKQPRCIVSPHNSFVGEGNKRRLLCQILKNLEEYNG